MDELDARMLFEVGMALAITAVGLAALAWVRRVKGVRAKETEDERKARLKSRPRFLPSLGSRDFQPLKGWPLVAVIALLIAGALHEYFGKR